MRRTWRFLTNCGMRSSICDFSSSDTIQGGTCSSLSHLVSPSPLPLPAPPVVSFPAASSTALLMQAHQIGTVLEKLSGNFFPFLVESSSTHLAQRIHYTKRERERERGKESILHGKNPTADGRENGWGRSTPVELCHGVQQMPVQSLQTQVPVVRVTVL